MPMNNRHETRSNKINRLNIDNKGNVILDVYVAASFIILILSNHYLLAYFLTLLLIYVFADRMSFRSFVLVFVFTEETIAYYIGGGLHGTATSLLEDYLRSIPIFLTHFYLWHKVSTDHIEFLAGLHGAFREIILPDYLSPAAVVIFGPVVFIYGYPLRRSKGYMQFSWSLRLKILLIEILVGLIDAIAVGILY